MISDSEISIIIQGPIHDSFVLEILAEIKEHFRESQIIFSTWNDSNVLLLPDDVTVIQNSDPGGMQIGDNPIVYDSANRQIISTIEGLKKANRKYSIKMRSDIFIDNKRWLKLFNQYQEYDSKYKFLKKRVMISSMFCVNPHKIPLPYHPSDWFFFGLTEDLVNIFDIPLLSEDDANYFKGKQGNEFSYGWHCRYRSEQHIWTSFIKKHYNLNFQHQNDVDNNNIEISDRIFANNAIIVDSSILGIRSFKYPNFIPDDYAKGYFSSNYYYNNWLNLYGKYATLDKIDYSFNYNRWKNSVLWAIENTKLSVYLILLYSGLLRYPVVKKIIKKLS